MRLNVLLLATITVMTAVLITLSGCSAAPSTGSFSQHSTHELTVARSR
jgi:hypothetical protein